MQDMPFVKNSKVVRSTKTSEVVEIKKQKVQYIGESEKSLKERFSQHLGYVYNEHINQATGEHFNSKWHTVAQGPQQKILSVAQLYLNL